MGYYTYFSLGIHDNKWNVNDSCVTVVAEVEQKVAKELAKLIYEIGSQPTEEDMEYLNDVKGVYDVLNDSMKWYRHEDDMCKLSAMFPELYFTLEGDGEEFDDYWRKLFHNGEHLGTVDGAICYPDFDIYYGSDENEKS